MLGEAQGEPISCTKNCQIDGGELALPQTEEAREKRIYGEPVRRRRAAPGGTSATEAMAKSRKKTGDPAKGEVRSDALISELRYRTLFDLVPVAVYSTDAEGVILEFNHRAAELWGREPDRKGEKFCGSFKLFHADGTPMPHDECPMARVLQGEELDAERLRDHCGKRGRQPEKREREPASVEKRAGRNRRGDQLSLRHHRSQSSPKERCSKARSAFVNSRRTRPIPCGSWMPSVGNWSI